MNARTHALSDALHRRAIDAHNGIVWLALDGRTPAEQARSELRQALQAHEAVTVALPHPQVDERLYPAWFRLDANRSSDSAILQLSIEIALDELDPRALRQGGGREVAGWLALADGAAPSEAASHLGRQMIQRHNLHAMLLRLHDPAVLWWLWQGLEAVQRAAMLGDVVTWWLLSPLGELHLLDRPSETESDTLTLDERQWGEVSVIAAMNRVLRNLDGRPDLQTLRTVRRAARRTHAHGLTDTGDQAAFILHALQVHPEFDSHPLLLGLLQRRQPDEFYAGLVAAELTDAAWRQVQRDCATLTQLA